MLVLKINDFFRELNNDGLSKRTTKEIVHEDIYIDNDIINWRHRIIKHIVFANEVVIENVDLICGLSFEHCEFNKGIVFKNVTVSEFDGVLFPEVSSIYFHNCKLSSLHITNCPFIKESLKLTENSEIERLRIEYSIIQGSGVYINNSIIGKFLTLNKVSAKLSIQNSEVNDGFSIMSHLGDITFTLSTFHKKSIFLDIECPESIRFVDSTFKENIEIRGVRLKKGLFFYRSHFEHNFSFDIREASGNGNTNFVNEIYITEAKFMEGVDFNGLGNQLQNLTLQLSPKVEGIITFYGWTTDSTRIYGINQNSKILFKRIVFRHLLINEFVNYGDISFNKCSAEGDSVMYLLNSDLGTTKFNEFNFDSFKSLQIDNTQLDSIKASNVQWFKSNKLQVGIENQEDIEKHRGKREIYRQLKQALKSNGNQIDSLLFQAREMQAYRNELKKSGKYSIPDRLIMTINGSNNYGLSWWKPTWIIGLITFGFYLIMLPAFSTQIDYTIDWSVQALSNTWSELINNFHVFWKLFNPTRKFSSVYGELDSAWLQFLDLIHRIILGIFIFQIIKGFRKFVSR